MGKVTRGQGKVKEIQCKGGKVEKMRAELAGGEGARGGKGDTVQRWKSVKVER